VENNVGKRLVRSPKVYVRDSGLVHALLGMSTLDLILGHPVAGASWEWMVIENITAALPSTASPWFYRTSAGAELDLLIDFDGGDRWAIEVKRSLAPSLSKGFHIACADVNAARRYLVYPRPPRSLQLDGNRADAGGTGESLGGARHVDHDSLVVGELGGLPPPDESEAAANPGVGARKVAEPVQIIDISGRPDILSSRPTGADGAEAEGVLPSPVI